MAGSWRLGQGAALGAPSRPGQRGPELTRDSLFLRVLRVLGVMLLGLGVELTEAHELGEDGGYL